MNRKKLAFVCIKGLDNFIHDIINNLTNDYEIKCFLVENNSTIDKAISWADIVWFEFCNEAAVIGTNSQKIINKKVIIRLHRYEVFTPMPRKINWDNVDILIFVAFHIKELFKKLHPRIENKVKFEINYPGLDLNKYRFQEKSDGYNIAYLGYINIRKNLGLALQIIKILSNNNSKYKLHVAGSLQDWEYKIYLDYTIKELDIVNNVIFYNWVKDINSWMQDKNYLLSTSIHEGHPSSILEAIACGTKPIIHNFPGARELYPTQWLFSSINEGVNMILKSGCFSQSYRSYIIDKGWVLQNQIKQIKNILQWNK